MEHRITADGIETFGVLTPWSGVRAIVLSREPAVTIGDVTVAAGYHQIVVELVSGDFLEIVEGSPSWQTVIEWLPIHRALLVEDVTALIASDAPGDTVLWHG